MPPQPPTTFRIEDLKARLKLEPKSRLFYPLAEELRKIGRFEDAEKVLRNGLTNHGSYTSAWISFGRVLIEQKKYSEAVEALQRAFTLDPGNIVAARLLADAYLGLDDKVEAIKKYKLVRALLPSDDEVEAAITRLEVELQRPTIAEVVAAPLTPEIAAPPGIRAEPPPLHPVTAEPVIASEASTDTEAFVASEPAVPITPSASAEGPVRAVDVDAAISGASFTAAADRYAAEIVSPRSEVVGEPTVADEELRDFPLPPERTSAAEPSLWDQDETIEEPLSSLTSTVAAPEPAKPERAAEEKPFEPPPFATPTIADLYAQQGHHEEAREIYNKIETPPASAEPVQSAPAAPAERPGRDKVARLENWLTRVTRK